MNVRKLLKPCPFCGSKAYITKHGDCYMASCQNLRCMIRPETNTYKGTPVLAIQEWNTRKGVVPPIVEGLEDMDLDPITNVRNRKREVRPR